MVIKAGKRNNKGTNLVCSGGRLVCRSGRLPSLPCHMASSRVFVQEVLFHARLVSRCGDAPGGKMPPDTAGKDARRYKSMAHAENAVEDDLLGFPD
jgi:hypothetical protein